MKKESYFDVLDSWKFLLCFLIFFEHFGILGFTTATGYIVVQVYFIISGFLLANSISKKKDIEPFSYNWNKIKKLLPLYFLGFICMFLYKISPLGNGLPPFSSIVAELFLIQKTGIFPYHEINPVSWYVSALLISTLVILLFHKAVKNKYLNYFVGGIIVIYYMHLMLVKGLLSYDYLFGFVDGDLFRGLSCTLLGIMTYEIYKNIEIKKIFTINIIEISSVILLLICLLYKQMPNFSTFILFAGVGIVFTASYNTGLISKILSLKVFKKVSSYSTSIYFTHLFSGGLLYSLNHL